MLLELGHRNYLVFEALLLVGLGLALRVHLFLQKLQPMPGARFLDHFDDYQLAGFQIYAKLDFAEAALTHGFDDHILIEKT